ncbi:MAG TPA: hypothetical protein VGV13_07790 [Methylomirabilota bacterium]|jgi:hypothetical protein|nr:hypothetical protein [Methylomirabilota bacterium]
MLAKFNLYDFIGVVVPGIFFLWALGAVLDVSALREVLPLAGGIAETSVVIVVGYVVGLLLQGISQQFTERLLVWWWGGFPSARWLLPEDQRFTKRYRIEVTTSLRARFQINLAEERLGDIPRPEALKRAQEIFYRCYRAVEKASELPQTFNAQYGLFRALLTTFVLLLIVSSSRLALTYRDGALSAPGYLALGVAIVGTVVSYWRVTKRGEDFAKAVYDVLLASEPQR